LLPPCAASCRLVAFGSIGRVVTDFSKSQYVACLSLNLWLPSRPTAGSRQILLCQRREKCVRGVNELVWNRLSRTCVSTRSHRSTGEAELPWKQLPSSSDITLQNYRKHLEVAAMPFVGTLLLLTPRYFTPPSLELLVHSPCPSEPEHLLYYCLRLCVMSGTFIRAIREPGDARSLLTVFHFKRS